MGVYSAACADGSVEVGSVGYAVEIAGHVAGVGVFDWVPVPGTLDAGAEVVFDGVGADAVGYVLG